MKWNSTSFLLRYKETDRISAYLLLSPNVLLNIGITVEDFVRVGLCYVNIEKNAWKIKKKIERT
jgi:hypothetical protein